MRGERRHAPIIRNFRALPPEPLFLALPGRFPRDSAVFSWLMLRSLVAMVHVENMSRSLAFYGKLGFTVRSTHVLEGQKEAFGRCSNRTPRA